MSEKNKDGLHPGAPGVPDFGKNTPNLPDLVPEEVEHGVESVAHLLEDFKFSTSIRDCTAFATMLGAKGRPPLVAFLTVLSQLRAEQMSTFSHVQAHELLATIRPLKERFGSSPTLVAFANYLEKITDELFSHVERLTPQVPHE